MILLTPGPCMTSESVRQAAAQPDMNHRDPAFLQLLMEVKAELRRHFGGFVPYLLGGSGTAAMEAAVSSCVNSGPALILTDGYYSERMAELFEVHKIPHESLAFPWLQGWDMDQLSAKLQEREWEWLVMTHHETTTGRLNPVEQAAAMAKSRGIKVLVDAMSSLGADPLEFEHLDVVVSSANKCLHGLPGVSFVLSRAEVPERGPRSFYLHLPRYAGDHPPLTAPVPMLLAFRQALREFDQAGGAEARGARYRSQAAKIREGLAERRVRAANVQGRLSCAVGLYELPEGWSFDAWFRHSYDRGYVLYGAKGDLTQGHFQVSPMGEVTDAMIEGWLAGLPAF